MYNSTMVKLIFSRVKDIFFEEQKLQKGKICITKKKFVI